MPDDKNHRWCCFDQCADNRPTLLFDTGWREYLDLIKVAGNVLQRGLLQREIRAFQFPIWFVWSYRFPQDYDKVYEKIEESLDSFKELLADIAERERAKGKRTVPVRKVEITHEPKALRKRVPRRLRSASKDARVAGILLIHVQQ